MRREQQLVLHLERDLRSLVVDLQKEKSDNMNLEVKVMSPRSIQAQASKMT